MSLPLPTPLLQRIASSTSGPRSIALCPDFEVGSWRFKQLTDHLFDWLPDVALRPDERLALVHEPNKQLARASRRLFDTDDPSKRGEIGEVLLHAICRQEFGTAPFVARLFYKMRSNDSVTSIDVAHLYYDTDTKKLELWLGEAKLYGDFDSAKYAALESVKQIWDPEFLTEMKALIGPKVEPKAPFSEELAWLFAEETSLDQIISRIVVPICLAVDCPETAEASSRSPDYVEKIKSRLAGMTAYYEERVPVEFVCLLVPMDNKEKLETRFNMKVQSFL